MTNIEPIGGLCDKCHRWMSCDACMGPHRTNGTGVEAALSAHGMGQLNGLAQAEALVRDYARELGGDDVSKLVRVAVREAANRIAKFLESVAAGPVETPLARCKCGHLFAEHYTRYSTPYRCVADAKCLCGDFSP